MSDADAVLHRMIAEACFGPADPPALPSDLRAFLEGQGVDAEDIDAIVSSPPRLALYRRLVRNNLVGVVSKMLPRTRARLNALASGAFDASFDEYLRTTGPRTHYLRDVPGEFVTWTAPRWRARPDIPPYAADLALHELSEFQIGAVPAPRTRPPLGEIALDRPLVFAQPHRLLRYGFAVHELPEDVNDRSLPTARPVWVLVYRDAQHDVGWMELPPLRATLFEALVAGQPLAQAVATATSATGVALTQDVLADAASFLAELGDEGILLGAAG